MHWSLCGLKVCIWKHVTQDNKYVELTETSALNTALNLSYQREIETGTQW